MATERPIFVSSSPSRSIIPITPPFSPTATISSSPSLPSPSRLFKKRPASFVDDSHATRSNDAVAEITSTSKFLGHAHVSNSVEDDTMEPGEELGKWTRLQSQKGKSIKPNKSHREAAVSTVKKSRAPKKTPTQSIEKAAVVKELPNISHEAENNQIQDSDKKRVRKSKSKADVQTKIDKGNITKPGVVNNQKIKLVASTKKPKKTHQSVAQTTIKETEEINPLGEEPLDLGLIEAIKRRKVWTPIKDTLRRIPSEDSGVITCPELGPEDCVSGRSAPSGFDDLLGDYGYARDDRSQMLDSEKNRDIDGQASTKRRKIELVNLAVYPSVPAAQPQKPKLPKKKPQTITEKATAPFLSEESAPPSLFQYLEKPVIKTTEDHQNEKRFSTLARPNIVAQRTKPKTTGKPTSKKSTSKAKNKTERQPLLLSPKTAMESTTDQELIFGTSSQLVRDESPTFIKDLQLAIEASELLDEQSGQILTKEASASSRSASTGVVAVTPFKSSRNLWSVAARDSDGSLLNTEVIDLVDTPKLLKPVPVEKPVATESEKPVLGLDPMEKGLRIARELSGISEPRLETNSSVYMKPLIEQNVIIEQSIPRSLAEASLRDRQKSRSPVKKQRIRKGSDVPALELTPGKMPDYQGFTTNDLSKEVAKYGFKAIKKRTEMIALLERCWESQSRIALQGLPDPMNRNQSFPKADSEIPKKASPKKKGRQRKADTTAKDNDQIPNNLSPKKSRGRPRKEKSDTSSSEKHASISQPRLDCDSIPPQVQGSDLPGTSVTIAPTSSPASPRSSTSQTTLLSRITQAIKTFPPTHSGTNPTFHEKILLYDPIVIEDLTAWLNTEGLGRVGVDDEVSGLLVKEWCEQRSVCCFWQAEGWRAKRA
ncbi:5'-flap endonuclease [Pseudocyphellaria aurata]|nr:5'-flap endonuclease [Pseudocyphellaria aurata]